MKKLFLFGLGLLAIDRLTKQLMMIKPMMFTSKLVRLELVKNTGVIWGDVSQKWIITASWIIIGLMIGATIRMNGEKDQKTQIGLVMIIAGGLSNLYDRMVWGFVVDWLWVFFNPIASFNLSDLMIVTGIVLIMSCNILQSIIR